MLIGLDVGTSVVKAVAFDQSGSVLGIESERLPLNSPARGLYEQDLEEILTLCATIIGRLVTRHGAHPDLICLTGQGDGLWLTDANGHAVRPPISWMDGRATSVLDEWTRTGVTEAVYRRNGNRMFAGTSAPLLVSLMTEEPDSIARAETAGTCKDAIFRRLTGRRETEPSDASIPLLDPVSRGWDDSVLELTGLTELRPLLPPVVDRHDATPLSAEGMALLGLGADTKIYNAPFDLPATATGAGANDCGAGLIVLGTTLGCTVAGDTVQTAGEPAGLTLCTANPSVWLKAMPAMVGTAALDWLLPVLGIEMGSIEGMLMSSFPGAGGVSALPFLSPSGERAPFVDARARGQFVGMDLQTTSAELVRALCEGVAFGGRNCLETAGLTDGAVSLTGGGAKSPQWVKIFANVLGRPISTMVDEQVGARGAVKSALAALNIDHDPDQWTSQRVFVEPDEDTQDFYQHAYDLYLESVSDARRAWDHQARLREHIVQFSNY